MGNYVTDEDRVAFATALDEGNTEDASPETPEAPEPVEEPDKPDEGAEEGTDQPVEDGEPAAEQLDRAPAEQSFPVQIDGQEVQVSLSELRDGYLRRRDYTQKAQEVGAQRNALAEWDALQRAFDTDPAQTLAILARHYNVPTEELPEAPDDVPRGPSVEERRLAELETWRENELLHQKEMAVDRELDRLHREYGDFDNDRLFGYAVQHELRDLEVALKAMNYGQAVNGRREEKRKVGAMAGGQGTNGVAHPKAPVVQINKFRDAYEAAKQELGT